MKKRIISILLTLCMMICLVPTGVFAEGETATSSAAIRLGADALNKTVNTANARRMLGFGLSWALLLSELE